MGDDTRTHARRRRRRSSSSMGDDTFTRAAASYLVLIGFGPAD